MSIRLVETIPFGHLTISYDGSVLTPRAWTERQSQLAVELAEQSPAGPVLEVFSGAGQIGLLAASQMERDLVQVDVDPGACAFARANAHAAGLAVTVDVRCGAPEDVLAEAEKFAVVIADPPWVPTDDIGHYPEDPPLAIDGGVDGLELVRHSVEVVGRHLAAGGHAVVQVGPCEQAEALTQAVRTIEGLECIGAEEFDRGALVVIRRGAPG
ncbi:methyltransferase domain-containing protein [Mumia qirimensis]|uniref:methyltransferase domain-containing protein n=1 Tax=Mumia qirimensis TaxID=3234852 RepID=UPI00351D1906